MSARFIFFIYDVSFIVVSLSIFSGPAIGPEKKYASCVLLDIQKHSLDAIVLIGFVIAAMPLIEGNKLVISRRCINRRIYL